MLYLCICIVLSLCFVYFRITFLPIEVKPCSRFSSSVGAYFFLRNVHLGCDLAKCWLFLSWFCLVTPSVICLFCQHMHDNTHTFIHTSYIVKIWKIIPHSHLFCFMDVLPCFAELCWPLSNRVSVVSKKFIFFQFPQWVIPRGRFLL